MTCIPGRRGLETEDVRPYLEIVKLVWPLALGMINNAVMQFVDRAYLARESMESLEAVLPASILAWIFMSFFQSVTGYANVFVAQYHGAQDEGKCRACYHAAMAIAGVSGLLMLPLLPFGDWILSLTATSDSLLARERTYYDIVILCGFAVYGQMAAASYFTGRGRTRIVFWVNLLGNLLNIALDPLLIFGCWGFPRLGIAGAAYATVFSMFVQMVVLIWAVRRERFRASSEAHELKAIILRILRFGVPSGAYTVLNMLSFTIFVFVTGGVGDLELAVSNACFTVNYLLIAPIEGFALGASTLVAQALGRKDMSAAEANAKRTLYLGVGFVAVLSLLVLLLNRPLLALFAPSDAAVASEFHSLGFILFVLMTVWQVFDAADVIVAGALKGGGDTKFVMWWMLIAAFVFWLPLVFVVRHFSNTMPALWSTMVIYVLVLCVGSVIRWRLGRWKMVQLT